VVDAVAVAVGAVVGRVACGGGCGGDVDGGGGEVGGVSGGSSSGGGEGMTRVKANLFFFCSVSAAEQACNKLDNGAYYKNVTSTLVWRPFIICDEFLLNGTIFFVLGTDQTYRFEWQRIFFISGTDFREGHSID
jgi:hypothetical protein